MASARALGPSDTTKLVERHLLLVEVRGVELLEKVFSTLEILLLPQVTSLILAHNFGAVHLRRHALLS